MDQELDEKMWFYQDFDDTKQNHEFMRKHKVST